MEVIILPNSEKASLLSAKKVSNIIKKNSQAVLGLATGKTPLCFYQNLCRILKNDHVDLSQVVSFTLDEYVGIDKDNESSYFSYMKHNWIEPLSFDLKNFFIPNGLAEDIPEECDRYESLIQQKGPIDLQLLGLGRDGHIGFNEPGSSLSSRTRLKTLTQVTRGDNSKDFKTPEEIPKHVITMGVATILQAKEIVLLAFGSSKAQAVRDFVEGPITAMVPASALQMHPRVQVFLDEESASLLGNRDYYNEVFANKPKWQMSEFL